MMIVRIMQDEYDKWKILERTGTHAGVPLMSQWLETYNHQYDAVEFVMIQHRKQWESRALSRTTVSKTVEITIHPDYVENDWTPAMKDRRRAQVKRVLDNSPEEG